jgi:NADP-dependent 3-hydroxy acid dehydrogenase YdfG
LTQSISTKVVVITWASSGNGAARRLAQHGDRLVLALIGRAWSTS